MLIILFIIFAIIEVILELLSIIDTEYEDCFAIVIPLAFLTRNKSPPLEWHSDTLPTVSQEVGCIWLLSVPNMVSADHPVCLNTFNRW